MIHYKVTGSIVLYNTDKVKLEKVIKSFFNSDISPKRLFLVDNSPTKKSFLYELLQKYKDIDYIFNNKNLGYGRAHNIAINKYKNKSDYHVILNPDIYFDKNVLPILYKNMGQDQQIGLSSVKILFPDNSQQFVHKKLPTFFDVGIRLFVKKIPLLGKLAQKIFKKSMDSYVLKYLDHKENIICPSISGCFMFFRIEALKQIKGFDDKFFMYYEDIDISRRCADNYKTIIFNDLHVFHNWERGSYKNYKLLRYHLSSTFLYFNKWGWLFERERKKLNKKITYYKK